MSIVIEHDKRRKEILEKALDVFMAEGFEDVTYQKIADRCGITRTTLYIYFKNKKEIFNYSIKQLMEKVENDIIQIRTKNDMSNTEKLISVLTMIIETLEENRGLLSVVLNYLLYLSKSDPDVDIRVRRRTIRLRHILAVMIIEGIRAGELKPMNVRTANDLIYGLIESAIFRLVILKRSSINEVKQSLILAVQRMQV
ncbi:MAG: TetR/AcrR family transcriptional regulator [Treponema sp.]|nr:TetR/AcrR family transcriptional regulator [Treponema sp.]